MPRPSVASLWESLSRAGFEGARALHAPGATVALQGLATGSALGDRLEELRDRSVLVSTSNQLTAALALIEVDGLARRLVLCPPDLAAEHLPYVVATAGIDAIVTDDSVTAVRDLGVDRIIECSAQIAERPVDREPRHETEWILFTSGTTGVPKMVIHTLKSLAGAIKPSGQLAGPLVWATFYDIRRYGGLQILLRAVMGGGSLLLSGPGEAAGDFMTRAKEHGVTHITGTPSHWRRALMSPSARDVSPQYARLSGEIADQAILDQLQAFFPSARVAHAFASTEAGVAFEVTDGRAGFPSAYIGRTDTGVDLRVENDTLHIRSPRTAVGYLGNQSESLLDDDGFVDTGDVLELRGDRYFFAGRRGGIINVGGLKIHPEEVEAAINRHPRVRMSLVKARKSPITGSIVAADVVLASDASTSMDGTMSEALKAEILDGCRATLAAHKVPAAIRFVASLDVTGAGKLVRKNG